MTSKCSIFLFTLGFTLFLSTLGGAAVHAQTFIRVDGLNGSANPTGLGSDWGQDAFLYLADAITYAGTLGGNKEIWVRGSTTGIIYKPDRDADNPNGSDPLIRRQRSFELASNVAIYGGFNGPGDDELADRDPETNITILSGDLDDNDTANFGNRGDNSLHVVTADSVGTTARLDGFHIRGGSAVGAYPDGNGGGILITAGNPSASARIVRCVFIDNQAEQGGGAA